MGAAEAESIEKRSVLCSGAPRSHIDAAGRPPHVRFRHGLIFAQALLYHSLSGVSQHSQQIKMSMCQVPRISAATGRLPQRVHLQIEVGSPPIAH